MKLLFRIWSKIDRKYITYDFNPCRGFLSGNGNIIFCNEINYDQKGEKFDFEDNFIFQQYVGIDDAFGKKIYIGGLLKYEFPKDNNIVTIVKWVDEYHDNFPAIQLSHNMLQGGKSKVIGNILENPELL